MTSVAQPVETPVSSGSAELTLQQPKSTSGDALLVQIVVAWRWLETEHVIYVQTAAQLQV